MFFPDRPGALALGLLLLVTGCSSSAALGSLELAGDADMNGGGNAAVVRVYQLNDDDAFRTVPIEEFWRNPELLAPALTAEPQEVLVYPGERQQLELTFAPTTRYVGVAADLRSPEGDAWRVLHPTTRLLRGSAEVIVGDRQLSINALDD